MIGGIIRDKQGKPFGKPGFIYVAKDEGGLVKIGAITEENNLPKAMYRISRQYKTKFFPLFLLQTVDVYGLENGLHRLLSPHRINRAEGRECFSLNEDQVSTIANIISYMDNPVKKVR